MGGKEKDYSILEINLDYGLGVTKKYRKRKEFTPGITLHIITTDNWKKKEGGRRYQFTQYITKPNNIIFHYNPEKIERYMYDKLKVNHYNTEIWDSVFSIFAIDLIESKSLRDKRSYKRPSSFIISDKVIISRIDYTMSERITIESRSYSEFVDTLSGLESINTKCYVALTESNTNSIHIDHSKNLSKPSLNSLYDISQSYFKFTIDVPTEMEGGGLIFDFGGAIELSKIYPEPDKCTMCGMEYTSLSKIEYIRNHGLWFHTKFKQMENLQILRMFVLTTLLGLFVALLFTSGWKSLKSICIKIVSKKEKSSESLILKEPPASGETGIGDINNNMTPTSTETHEDSPELSGQ
jgi:hypothetical protein